MIIMDMCKLFSSILTFEYVFYSTATSDWETEKRAEDIERSIFSHISLEFSWRDSKYNRKNSVIITVLAAEVRIQGLPNRKQTGYPLSRSVRYSLISLPTISTDILQLRGSDNTMHINKCSCRSMQLDLLEEEQPFELAVYRNLCRQKNI